MPEKRLYIDDTEEPRGGGANSCGMLVNVSPIGGARHASFADVGQNAIHGNCILSNVPAVVSANRTVREPQRTGSTSAQKLRAVGGVCSDWLWLDETFGDGRGCVCPFEYGGHFCEEQVYEEVTESTAWGVGIYNVTLRLIH